MLSNITVLPDESLGGIEREYREVNRKAAVGERIKIVNPIASFGDYERGDIMTVYSTGSGGVHTVETAEGWDGCGHIFIGDDEYVTLEPTDTVHLPIKGRISGTERFRMVDRKAAMGDRVIIVNEGRESCGGAYYRKGNVGYFVEYGQLYENIRVSFDGTFRKCYVSPGDYRVLEPLTVAPLLSEQSAQDQAAATISALALRLDALTERMDALEAKVDAAYTTQLTTEADPEAVLKAVRKFSEGLKRSVSDALKTPQQRRDEIVERAKADVKELAREDGKYLVPTSFGNNYVTNVEFIVNRDKRKVTAILRGAASNKVRAVGRAKCAPNDVFNAHIGKAISLRRALGLDVPAESAYGGSRK
ncbi:hypothetical protein PPSQR21_032480 [Paenibacillus polymyxa SQR-21]|uniref:hypothetical protein n=1 Tax=Paenibacillus polymyxa TaxID=1406 RepID=UPI00042EA2CB|nr:hypothetical protein [Paenibacillus polymyxa]AHM66887.1 hypothetical protein PPSQR21_032480 [Paenibacillus polymyxa SQR-21]